MTIHAMTDSRRTQAREIGVRHGYPIMYQTAHALAPWYWIKCATADGGHRPIGGRTFATMQDALEFVDALHAEHQR